MTAIATKEKHRFFYPSSDDRSVCRVCHEHPMPNHELRTVLVIPDTDDETVRTATKQRYALIGHSVRDGASIISRADSADVLLNKARKIRKEEPDRRLMVWDRASDRVVYA